MGDSITVPTNKLTSTGQVLQGLSASAHDIADGLKAADPPGVLWGGLGLLMKPFYDSKADEVREHVKKIAEALDSQGGAVKAVATRHQKLDEEHEQAFKRFQDKLSGGK